MLSGTITILEQFVIISLILGAYKLGAQIKVFYKLVLVNTIIYFIIINDLNSPEISILRP